MRRNDLSSFQSGECERGGRDGESDVAARVLHQRPLSDDATDRLHHFSLAVHRLQAGRFAHLADTLSVKMGDLNRPKFIEWPGLGDDLTPT